MDPLLEIHKRQKSHITVATQRVNTQRDNIYKFILYIQPRDISSAHNIANRRRRRRRRCWAP